MKINPDHPGMDRLINDVTRKPVIEIDENHPVLGGTIKLLFEVYEDEVIKLDKS